MIRITFFENPQDTTGTTIEAEAGVSVMKAAIAADIEGVAADCGGTLSCATCHVYIEPDWVEKVGARNPMEEDMLDFAFDVRDNSRLSCQIKVSDALDGLRVKVPEKQF